MAKVRNGDVAGFERDKGAGDWGPEAGEALLTPQAPESGVKQFSPGQPILGTKTLIDSAESQAAWLAEAKEIERVLLLGDHASPVRTAQLLAEAIPVVEAYVPPVADETKRQKAAREKAEEREEKEEKKEEKRER